MSRKYNHYLGKAGHLYIMSELLFRGWNVAIPEVDVGDDIFVVKDDSGQLQRVQVKTALAKTTKQNFAGQFNISLKQLLNITPVKIQYVFLFRFKEVWSSPIIIDQEELKELYDKKAIGTQHKDNLNLYISVFDKKVICSKEDFSSYVNNYSAFPVIHH
jgi:hypothetical protein